MRGADKVVLTWTLLCRVSPTARLSDCQRFGKAKKRFRFGDNGAITIEMRQNRRLEAKGADGWFVDAK